MKSHYFGLWTILSLSLVILLVIAFADDIHLGSYTVKKAPFADNLLADNSVAQETDSTAIALEDLEAEPECTVDSTAQTILIFGDSMTLNLAYRLAAYGKQNGHEVYCVNWDSSNTKIWAESDTLQYFIDSIHPTYFFISLGSNEVYFKDPYARKPYVDKILKVIGERPYVWIGPPNWNEDTGINDMLAEATRPGSFFRSAGMQFERKKDKIHPTRAASALWVDSVMRWMPKSSHPILCDFPVDSLTSKARPHIVFLKALNK